MPGKSIICRRMSVFFVLSSTTMYSKRREDSFIENDVYSLSSSLSRLHKRANNNNNDYHDKDDGTHDVVQPSS